MFRDPRRAFEAPPIRVASVPGGHWYVRHLAEPGAGDVLRLPDAGEREGPHGWWPPAMLDAAWVDANAHEFDVFHVHFGFDGVGVDELDAVVQSVKANGKALVYTVHDLQNPHQPDAAEHDARVELLMREADQVITLTPRAAAEISTRWSRDAEVIPHPHILPADQLPPPEGARPAAGRVATAGVHLKSLRPNMFGAEMLRGLETLVRGARDLKLRVDVHDEVDDPGLRRVLRELARSESIEVHEHGYFTDQEFYEYLRGIDVAVLPYRFGTHSGWLEACRDVGTAVVAPDNGCYLDQGPVFAFDPALPEPERWGSMFDAIRRAAAARRRGEVGPFGRRERLTQRSEIAAAHRWVYEAAIRDAASRVEVAA